MKKSQPKAESSVPLKALDRSQIEEKFKWKLTEVFLEDKKFEKELKSFAEKIPSLELYSGILAESAENLIAFFKLREELFMQAEKLIVYARLNQDCDTRVDKYRGYTAKMNELGSRFAQAVSWYAPELLSIPWETIESWLEEPELDVYRHYLEDEFRIKDHILSHEGEHILALSSLMAGGISGAFGAFNNADIGAQFPNIIDDEGNEVQITAGRYYAYLETGSPRLRKDAFEGYFKSYSQFTTTLAAMLKAQIDKDVFYSRARNYNSSLEAALSGDNIPATVYTSLIEAVHRGLPVLHEYIDLRKKILKLDEIHLYDTQVHLFPAYSEKVTYDESRKLIIDSMAPLGSDYIVKMNKAFDSRWIDVYENAGKATGAYNMGVYTLHPFILLNYNDTLGDVFTISHELGHAMHSLYTSENQPYIYGNYSIFAAEVASTFNEALLMDYLLINTDDRLKKLNLLARSLNNFNGTLITQSMFAEFELIIHRMAEAGEPLTADALSNTFFDLLKQYYGDGMTYHEYNAINWCRIPHFYYNFYVYKYATSFAAASALSRKVISGEGGSAERYLEFLSSGSSDYPIELLKKAGVDMSTPDPVVEAMNLYAGLVKQMKELAEV